MIDRFFYNHFEYRLDNERRSIHKRVFEDLLVWLKAEFEMPLDELLNASNYVQIHERFHLLELDWHLRELPRHSQLGRLLIEAAMLHRYQMAYLELGSKISPKQTRSMATVKMITIRKLSDVILQVAPDQLQTILQLGKLPNMDAATWKRLFAYAASFAYVVQVFDSLHECSVFPSSLHEGIDIGLDMVVIDNDSLKGFCVQVNCGDPKREMWVEPVLERPTSRETDTRGQRRKRIFDGTEQFNKFNDRNCTAIRTVVGRVGEEVHDLCPLDMDRARARKVLQSIAQQEHNGGRRLAAHA
jgi:hypothetical protein